MCLARSLLPKLVPCFDGENYAISDRHLLGLFQINILKDLTGRVFLHSLSAIFIFYKICRSTFSIFRIQYSLSALGHAAMTPPLLNDAEHQTPQLL
jgi:hypothetical protein